MKPGKLLIIIPAFNEALQIANTIKGLKKVAPKQSKILVVDDGSTDDTAFVATNAGAFVVRHLLNRGLGGALGTGLAYAKNSGVKRAVTFDADGQHNPTDLIRMLRPLQDSLADVVIGSRTLKGWKKIPRDRKIIFIVSNWLTWLLFGIRTSDSLSGFRAFNRAAIDKITIMTDQMEVSNEFFSEIRRQRLRLKEIPIKVIYSDYSRSKGQKNSNALVVGVKLLLRLFR